MTGFRAFFWWKKKSTTKKKEEADLESQEEGEEGGFVEQNRKVVRFFFWEIFFKVSRGQTLFGLLKKSHSVHVRGVALAPPHTCARKFVGWGGGAWESRRVNASEADASVLYAPCNCFWQARHVPL